METQWSPLKQASSSEPGFDDVYQEFNDLITSLGDGPQPSDVLLPAENNQAATKERIPMAIPKENELLLQSVQALTSQMQSLSMETKRLAQEELTLRSELERVANQVETEGKENVGTVRSDPSVDLSSQKYGCKYTEMNKQAGHSSKGPRMKNQYSQSGKC